MNEEKIIITLNGEEKALTLDELKNLAEMNDKLTSAIDKISHREGITREECIDAILGGEDYTDKRWSHFFNEYPDANTDELDEGFFSSLDIGITPTEAYQKILIAALQEKLRETENRKSSLGSAKSEIAGEVADKFLEGFFGAKY